MFLPALLSAQRGVTGHVTDSLTGKPLSGANIRLAGEKTGSTTDASGYYSLSASDQVRAWIEVSYMGYRTVRTSVGLKENRMTVLDIRLAPVSLEMSSVFITANRIPEKRSDIGATVYAVPRAEVQNYPCDNAEDVLHILPGMNLDRGSGIFSKNASLTMRGLNGGPRTLILLDGIPLNKTDGGGINWNLIDPEMVEKIEVVKGPASTVYGGNAMSGVVNVITAGPEKPLQGYIKGFYGTYNTRGGNMSLGGRTTAGKSGFYWMLNGFYRKGDGYNPAPEASRDSLDTKMYLKEMNTGVRLGYTWGSNSFLEVNYILNDNKMGDGTRIYEPEGGYNRYKTNILRATLHSSIGKTMIFANAFFLDENYLRQAETKAAKNSGKYTLYHTDADRIDKGLWLTATRNLAKGAALIAGIDLKQGNVNASDTYLTSSDIMTNKGNMNFYALFAEYQQSLLGNKVKAVAGLRYDRAMFDRGSFTIEGPSTLTAFMTAYPTVFTDEDWQAVSPKVTVKYSPSGNLDLYICYGRGFRPPMLDDMCRNGNVNKGFKLANPSLKPESLDNFEMGAGWRPWKGITLEPALYYSMGNDFQYFVGTGDSVYTGGNNLKAVIRRENVGQARVLGCEINLQAKLTGNISFSANYAYNHSVIHDFDLKTYVGKDLSGKYLMEVAPNQAYAGITWINRYFGASVFVNYKDRQWVDDENTQQTGDYTLFDGKMTKHFGKSWLASVNVHDIFDSRYTDNKGNLSPGRFFMLSLTYRLN